MDCHATPRREPHAQFRCRPAMAVQAERAQVGEVALSASLCNWQDVVRVPQAFASQAPQAPDTQQLLKSRGSGAAKQAVRRKRVYRAAGADATVALQYGSAKIGRAGAQPPLVHAIL